MNKYIAMTVVAILVATSGTEVKAIEIVEGLSIKGDLRLRHESIDKEGKETRDRQRVRARLELSADVTETVSGKIRLASGSSDPVSSNQTLDDSFSSKEIHLDRAYIKWAPEAFEGSSGTLMGGKMAQPWVKRKGLVWDSDLNPEGFAYTGKAGMLFWNASYLIAEERSEADETTLAAAQLGSNFELGEGVKVEATVSIYSWDNMEGHTVMADSEDSFGNTAVEGEDGDLLYASEFEQVAGSVKIGLGTELPVTVYGDYIVNNDASTDQDTAYLIGFTVGKASAPGSFQLDYNFREVEADSVVGAFTDSDFIGGGTDGDGSKVQVKYQMDKNWQVAATYLMNTIGLTGEETDYDRFQLDLVAKF